MIGEKVEKMEGREEEYGDRKSILYGDFEVVLNVTLSSTLQIFGAGHKSVLCPRLGFITRQRNQRLANTIPLC